MARKKTLKPGRSEGQVQEGVLEVLGWFAGQVELDRQNPGGTRYADGQYVRHGKAGQADFGGMILKGPWAGRVLALELKHEFFDPTKARGEKRERFERQLARLKAVNAGGGLALWVDSPEALAEALPKIMQGMRVDFTAEGWPYLTDEPMTT